MCNRVNVLCKYLSDICDVMFAARVKVARLESYLNI